MGDRTRVRGLVSSVIAIYQLCHGTRGRAQESYWAYLTEGFLSENIFGVIKKKKYLNLCNNVLL